MPQITIYTKATCPYCHRAKALLVKKGAEFEEVPVDSNPTALAEMIEKARGRTTVPQIFIGDRHIGGCDDMFELSYDGKLDPLLAG